MTLTATKSLSKLQKAEILELWNNEYPDQLGFSTINDFENYLRTLAHPNHILALDETAKIAGWAFTFTRDDERWFAIIVNSKYQRSGIGSQLLNQLKENEKTLNGWVTDHNNYKKTDGTPYLSPQDFYRKNGFSFLDKIRLETEKLSAVKINWKVN